MKKLMLIVIMLSILCTMMLAVNADSEIIVTIDGEMVEFDTPPIIENDRVLVPMRNICEKMGAEVYWLDEQKQASAVKENTEVNFFIDSSSMIKADYSVNSNDSEVHYFVDGMYKKDTSIELDVPAQMIEDKTYVPLRAISEAFGYTVIWNDLFWPNVSIQSSIPTNYDEIIALLLNYDIISEDDIDKDLYITNLEALKAIRQVMGGGIYESDLRDWYIGDTLAPLDYLDNEMKELLLSISGRRGIIKTEEILNTDIYSYLNEYQALVYLTRMIGNTYGCTDYPAELDFTEASQTYNIAAEKGLIDTADMTNADNAITRKDFYALLTKAIYTPFMSGGYVTYEYRYIENLKKRAEHIVSDIPKLEEKEVKKININAEFGDDMSLHWTVPEKYRNSGTQISYITAEGEIQGFSYRLFTRDNVDADEIIKMISYNDWNVPKAIRCEYFNDNDKVYFDIDLSNIEFIRENYTIEPGIYTPFERQWVPKYITLAKGYSFKKGAYYMLISYTHDYRLPEYNNTYRMIIKSEDDTSIFSNAKHDMFKCGGIDFDDMHIREITIDGSAKNGFKIHVSEESKEAFEINEE